MGDYGYNKDKGSFKEILHGHLKKILDITTNEFRGGYYRTSVQNNTTVEEYIPDSRKCYIQAIESFSDVLLPYFDKEMNEAYNAMADDLELSRQGLLQLDLNSDERQLLIINRLELMRRLFQQLNLLLKRVDYLKVAIYEETEGDL